jgi:hypothetical protein
MAQKNPPIKAMFGDIQLLTAERIIPTPAFKDLLKDHVFPCIKAAFKSNKMFATIFEINSSGNFIDIQKKDWVKALNVCMSWYVEDEQYAICTEISGLIKEIESKSDN